MSLRPVKVETRYAGMHHTFDMVVATRPLTCSGPDVGARSVETEQLRSSRAAAGSGDGNAHALR
jgi:hypothetical protein